MITINVKRNSKSAVMPEVQTKGSAGADLCADVKLKTPIRPNETVMIPSNIAMEIPDGYFGAIYPRSGLSAKQGIRLANCVAVIDSDYRGNIGLPMHNDSCEVQWIYPQQRIAQIIIQPYANVIYKEVENLSETERGANGFGSTGR